MTLAAALVLGIVIGVSLGALGGGGSILTVPALVYVLDEPARAATTGSLVIVGVTAMAGALGHARSGNVRWRSGGLFALVGVAASVAGTALNRLVAPDVLLLAFSALMLVAAFAMLRRAAKAAVPLEPALVAPTRAAATGPGHPGGLAPDAEQSPDSDPRWNPELNLSVGLKIAVAGSVVGFLTGFLGVGGGFIIVPALVMALDFPMSIAVGTSLLVIALNSVAALAARAGSESFHWAVIVPFTVAAIAGSVAGRRIAGRVSGASLGRAFAGLLIAVAVYVAIRTGLDLV